MDKTGILITGNVYGYQINISHPSIKPLYDRFKKWKGIPDWCPLSDEERFEFESYIIKKMEKSNERTGN